jgi:2-keto-4-pentenoate hydratase/2-oxohepta-3-ene-1,7-dioic acid hydratase in catechol pathway
MKDTYPRIFCVGRNYAKHIEELSNERPRNPVVFMKPYSSLVYPGTQIHYPPHGNSLHHEVELVVRIGKNGKARGDAEALEMIDAFSVGIDLTLRDVQKELKEKGLPWEIAKAFDGSSPVGEFYPYPDSDIDFTDFELELSVNGEIRQKGNTGMMLFPVAFIIRYLSEIWELRKGDLIYTGTPAGVSELNRGDEISISGTGTGAFNWEIV